MTDTHDVHGEGVHDEDGYDGPAELITASDGDADGTSVAVQVSLRGHFEPISGSYRWYGRVAASPELTELVGSGTRSVLLRTPHGEVETPLTDVDPWGRPRVAGFGAAPFATAHRPAAHSAAADVPAD